MTTINYKFAIDEIVQITALDLTGRVIGLWTGKRGNEIEVRFCANSEYKNIYFFEDELRTPTEKHPITIQ